VSYTETIADGTVLGDVPGIHPGTFFRDRQELHDKKLHRGLMRGIASHGSSSIQAKVGVIPKLGDRLLTSNRSLGISPGRKSFERNSGSRASR